MFSTQAVQKTRVVSLNTDSIVLQVQPQNAEAVDQLIADWESTFGFSMERTEVLAHRGVNINTYVELVREGDGEPEIKSKGLLAHDPGISADHNALVVAQAIGQWLLDGTDVETFIRAAAARQEILRFTEMRSAPSSGLRYGGVPIGRLARVYRSIRTDLPVLTKDATGAASEQTLEAGFAYLPGTSWPVENDVDVDWYVLQARLVLAQTSVPYSPHHNRLARELMSLGLVVAGVGGAATVIRQDMIDEMSLARGTDKYPRNFSGDRGLAVSVAKSAGVVALPPGVASTDSLVLRFGTDTETLGEIHDRQRLGDSLRQLRKQGVEVVEKGYATVFDLRAGLQPLSAGDAVSVASNVVPVMVDTSDQQPADIVQVAGDPADLSNDDFLQAMFGARIADAFVCSNTTPPDTPDEQARMGMWVGGPLEFSRGLYRLPERQNYTCVSTFRRDSEDVYRRQIEYFEALHFIVLDDIGTKVPVDPRSLGLGEPTVINETSPGNFQWLYKLSEPITDISLASFLVKQVLSTPVQGQLMTDQGSKGVTRLCKLPQGMNLKLSLPQPWQNRVHSWRPDLIYSASEIAGWFGASLTNVQQVHARPAASAADAADHPLVLALQSAHLLKGGQQKGSGWWDVTCFQRHLHTNGVDNGTAVKVREDGSWTFKCQHGHCSDLTPRDLYRWLVEQGFSVTPPQHRTNVARIDRDRLSFEVPAAEVDEFGFLDPDDGGAGDEVILPDPEFDGGGNVPIGTAGGGGGGRPVIYIDPGMLPSIVKQCAALLDDVVFKRGIYLVRIGHGAELVDGLSRIGTQPVVLPVTRPWLIRELTALATFQRWDKKSNDYKVTDCPTNVAIAVELGTDDFTFNPLTALANTPFLRVDGSICDVPGYDVDTGIFYAPNLSFPPILSLPSWHDARAALDELAELVKQFPFANAVSRSVFLADVLTAIARPTLPKSPMVLYSATMAGSGKTLMASIANLIAYGHATTHPWPGANEEELKKVFTSVLLAGDPVVVFDNLPNGAVIKSAALSQFVTSDDYADRKLGESQRVKFRNRTRVVLTGNNVTLASDNARRTLVCDLQLQVESLKDRLVEFELPNLSVHIKLNRARYVAAALTVLRAYAVHPEPLLLPALDSFEDWSWRVRDALVWLGEEDPVAAVEYDNDGSAEIGAAYSAIASVVQLKLGASQSMAFRANELVNWASGNALLRDSLEQAGCSDAVNASKVGYWLRAHKNRIASGLKLTSQQVDGGRQPNRWQLVAVAE
jgi:putative DNA primase/helicase